MITAGGLFRENMLGKIRREFEQARTLLQFGFFNGLGQAFGMIAPLLVAKFLASAELYASYSLAVMIVFLFSTLFIASAQTPFVVFANQERVNTGKINKAFSVQLSFFALSFCIFFGTMLPMNKFVAGFAKINGIDLLFVLLAFAGLALKSFIYNLFMAMGQRIKSSVVELVFGGLTLCLVIILYRMAALNLRTVFLVYLVSGLVVLLVAAKLVDFAQLLPIGVDPRLFKEMLNFTKWVMLGSTAVYFINWGHNFVLRLFESLGVVSMADIGSYNLAYQIFKGVAMLTFLVNAYFLPFISQHIQDSTKIRLYLYNKRPKIFLLGLALIGTLFVIVPYALKLAYRDVYQGSITVLRTLLIASALILYSIFYETIVLAVKKYKFTQAVYVVQVLLSLLLALFLVPAVGIFGAAVAAVAAYLFRAASMETYFRVKLKRLLKV